MIFVVRIGRRKCDLAGKLRSLRLVRVPREHRQPGGQNGRQIRPQSMDRKSRSRNLPGHEPRSRDRIRRGCSQAHKNSKVK